MNASLCLSPRQQEKSDALNPQSCWLLRVLTVQDSNQTIFLVIIYCLSAFLLVIAKFSSKCIVFRGLYSFFFLSSCLVEGSHLYISLTNVQSNIKFLVWKPQRHGNRVFIWHVMTSSFNSCWKSYCTRNKRLVQSHVPGSPYNFNHKPLKVIFIMLFRHVRGTCWVSSIACK